MTVAVQSQITAVLTNVNFQEGQDVKKGDILFQMDSVPEENALALTEANLAKDKIQ